MHNMNSVNHPPQSRFLPYIPKPRRLRDLRALLFKSGPPKRHSSRKHSPSATVQHSAESIGYQGLPMLHSARSKAQQPHPIARASRSAISAASCSNPDPKNRSEGQKSLTGCNTATTRTNIDPNACFEGATEPTFCSFARLRLLLHPRHSFPDKGPFPAPHLSAPIFLRASPLIQAPFVSFVSFCSNLRVYPPPRRLHRQPQCLFLYHLQIHIRATSPSPRSVARNKYLRLHPHKLRLLLRRQFHHPPLLARIRQGGEDLPIRAKIRMIHMLQFHRSCKTKRQFPEFFGASFRLRSPFCAQSSLWFFLVLHGGQFIASHRVAQAAAHKIPRGDLDIDHGLASARPKPARGQCFRVVPPTPCW